MSNASRPPSRINGAIDLGSAAPDSTYDFVVGVETRQPALLMKFLTEQKVNGDTLGPIDFGEKFGVSQAEYNNLVSWLRGHGMQVTRTVQSRNTISVHATAAQIESAFGAHLHDFSDAAGRFTASIDGLTLSSEVAGSVSGIAGDFDGSKPWRSHMVRPGTANVPPSGPLPATAAPVGSGMGQSYQATQLEALYQSNAIVNPGKGQTIIILGAGLPPDRSDIDGYFTTDKPYGLTKLPGTYDVVKVGGDNRDPIANAQGEQGENILDAEMVFAFAPYATVHHVVTASNGGLFADGISYIVDNYTQGANLAVAVTVSYGQCEREAESEMPLINAMFMQAQAAGQTWFFASGDDGTNDCQNGTGNTVATVNWPSSSPYVVGVGGTGLAATAAVSVATGEVPWNNYDGSISHYGQFNFAGSAGGGESEAFDKPTFQTSVGPNSKDGSRDVPDVSALGGDPGVEVYQGGQVSLVAGTSAATPMWAGILALIAQGKGKTGFTNTLDEIYTLGKAGKGFNDIIDGSIAGPGNSTVNGFPSAAGYDLATGWGTPIIPTLITNWQ